MLIDIDQILTESKRYNVKYLYDNSSKKAANLIEHNHLVSFLLIKDPPGILVIC